ncbi:hypothetical protein [Algibacter sp. PT7-4]|uniref:hypothetical protein n=1 Tax=Algibacter ulvanivorans TaxID=3400999 RepID=UPI003AAC7911
MKNPIKVSERYIKASETKGFSYTDELVILEYLLNKFNLKSKTQYAKQEGISIAGVNDRIKRGKVMYIQTIGKIFIIQ